MRLVGRSKDKAGVDSCLGSFNEAASRLGVFFKEVGAKKAILLGFLLGIVRQPVGDNGGPRVSVGLACELGYRWVFVQGSNKSASVVLVKAFYLSVARLLLVVPKQKDNGSSVWPLGNCSKLVKAGNGAQGFGVRPNSAFAAFG